jgi:hypothetical protein
MAMTMNALIYPHTPNLVVERRMIDVATIPPNKSSWWRPVVVVGDDAFDRRTHKKTGPVTTIEATRVLDTYSIVALTAQEISDAKDAAVNALNNSDYKALLAILLEMVNDDRAIRTKLNALIDATNQSATVPKFSAGQSSQINLTQLKAAIKNLLT